MDELNIDNFNEKVINNVGTVLIDFYATWCGPCKMMSPIIDKIKDSTNNLSVYKVDVDRQAALAEKFNVMSIPTIIIFKNGVIEKTFVGLTPEEKILEVLQ